MSSLTSRWLKSMLLRSRLLGGEITVQERRQRIEERTRWLRPAKGVQITQIITGGNRGNRPVPAEWLKPKQFSKNGVILYIHGGAFVICSLNTHRSMVSRLVKAAGVAAVSLDYRLAPEYPYPAALEDCLSGYRWLLESGYSPEQIVIAGDSAGGNLTLALMLRLKAAGEPLPAGAVCFSPVTDLVGTGESIVTKADIDPILDGSVAHQMVQECYVREHDQRDPLISPLYGELSQLPPILLHVGEDEILLDDSVRFAARARDAGTDAQLVIWPGMWHVFQIFAPILPEANQAILQAGGFIQRVLRGSGIP